MNLFDNTMRPHHYGIFVANHDRSVRWYQEKMKFRILNSVVNDGVFISFLEAGAFLLEIVENTRDATWQHAPGTISKAHLAFLTKNIDAKADEARARGLRFFIEPTTNPVLNARYFHILDPDGHIIEFFEDLTSTQ